MRAAEQLRLHSGEDLGVVMSKQERAVTHHVVDQAVAIDVPLVRA